MTLMAHFQACGPSSSSVCDRVRDDRSLPHIHLASGRRLREPPLGIRHVYLSWRVSDFAKARRHTSLSSSSNPRPTKPPVHGAPVVLLQRPPPNSDFDLQASPEHILDGSVRSKQVVGKSRRQK